MLLYITKEIHFFIMEFDENKSLEDLTKEIKIEYENIFIDNILPDKFFMNTFEINSNKILTDTIDGNDKILLSLENQKSYFTIYFKNPKLKEEEFLKEGDITDKIPSNLLNVNTKYSKDKKKKFCYTCDKPVLIKDFDSHLEKHLKKPFMW
jgi:hypothetical protein